MRRPPTYFSKRITGIVSMLGPSARSLECIQSLFPKKVRSGSSQDDTDGDGALTSRQRILAPHKLQTRKRLLKSLEIPLSDWLFRLLHEPLPGLPSSLGLEPSMSNDWTGLLKPRSAPHSNWSISLFDRPITDCRSTFTRASHHV